MTYRNSRNRLIAEMTMQGFSEQDIDCLAAAIRTADFGEDITRSVSALAFALSKPHGMQMMRLDYDSFWLAHEQYRTSDEWSGYDVHGVKAT